MIRRIRRSLARIRYYSASRNRSRVQVATDRALVISLPLAVAAVFVAESIHEFGTTAAVVSGQLFEQKDGTVLATVDDTAAAWPAGVLAGEWSIESDTANRGWPIATGERRETPRLDLNDFDEVGTRRGVSLPPDSPIRGGIDAALRDAGKDSFAFLERSARPFARHWIRTVAGIMVWWVMIFIASAIGIRIVAVTIVLRRIGRSDRSVIRESTGRCAVCNYDLRGTEFSARCPECGTLVR